MPSWFIKSITSVNIPETAKVILPIHLFYHAYNDPERLKVLVEHYSQYQLTVLLADGLNRFNVGDEQARRLGDEYIDTHKEVLSKVTLVRWDEWIAQRQDKVSECRKLIEEECKPSSSLHNKCLKSIKSFKNEWETNNAVEYLKEELAAILVMSDEYDFHVYARQISPAVSKLYKMHESDFHLPAYVHVSLSEKKCINESRVTLPASLRLIVQQFTGALTSDEIEPHFRAEMAAQICQVIDSCIPIQKQLQKTSHLRLFLPQESTKDGKVEVEEQQPSAGIADSNKMTPAHD